MRILYISLLMLGVGLCFPRVGYSAAEGPEYEFANLTDSGSTTLIVPSRGIIELALVRTGTVPTEPETLSLRLTPLISTSGDATPARLSLLNSNPSAGALDPGSFKMTDAVMGVGLNVGLPAFPQPYNGQLIISRSGVVLKRYEISVRRPATEHGAKIVLDQTSLPIKMSEPLFPYFHEDQTTTSFTVSLHDVSGDWQIQRVKARVESRESPDGRFDPRQQIKIHVAGEPIDDFWTAGYSVPAAADELVLEGHVSPLRAGQYKAKIRFLAANSAEDPGQILDLDIKVRKSAVWAFIFLGAGILVSLITTVLLKSRAEMLRVRQKIRSMFPEWLANEPPSLLVTWVQAVFNQAENMPKHSTVTATDVLEERVTEATAYLPLLSQAKDLRNKIDGIEDPMIRRRAERILRRTMDQLSPGPLDKKAEEATKAGLDTLEKWFNGNRQDLYWADLFKEIEALQSVVNIDDFYSTEAKEIAQRLLNGLGETKPASLEDMVDREDDYAKLKLLWERREDPAQVDTFVQLSKGNRGIDAFFKAADDAIWHKLQQHEIVFTSPERVSLDPFEPFVPLLFEVQPAHAALGDNYLFKHNLRYDWTFDLVFKRFLRKVRIVSIKQHTQQPTVYQFAPAKCTVVPRANLHWGKEEKTVNEEDDPTKVFSFSVGRSALSRWLRSVAINEWLSTLFAVVVGIATGFYVQYLGNDTFGSIKDCVGLFLWGAGSDQASKSFLDVLSRFRPGNSKS